jgi:hypothetical protein
MNAWDKGLGSALTYAERYYLMKTFHIATDEDDIDALVKDEAIKPAPSQAVQARRKAADRAEIPPYTPMSPSQYWGIVKAYAEGKKTKTGGDYRETWAKTTNAREEHILQFDKDVDDYKAANNL